MKNLAKFFMISLISFYAVACGENQTLALDNGSINSNNTVDKTIYVYYFHTNIRCETCIAVDEHTENYLKVLFPKKMENKEITFESINIEEKGHEDLVKKYQIYGQTLLFIKGDTSIDRTNDAFMNVTTDPEKWKAQVKAQIEDLLKL